MGADNALDVAQSDGGRLTAAVASTPAAARLRAHFRSDAAQLAKNGPAPATDALVLPGVVAQSIYVGQGYRYRVRSNDADVWVHAHDRIAEGTPATVVVPRDSVLLFPAQA
jgi:hypothetical protein